MTTLDVTEIGKDHEIGWWTNSGAWTVTDMPLMGHKGAVAQVATDELVDLAQPTLEQPKMSKMKKMNLMNKATKSQSHKVSENLVDDSRVRSSATS